MQSIKTELEDLDECMDSETVVDLIHKIVPSLIGKKDKDFSYSSESSEDSDSVEIIKVKEKKAVPHKQRRKARLRIRSGIVIIGLEKFAEPQIVRQ